jgi:DNA polymerase III subunit delta
LVAIRPAGAEKFAQKPNADCLAALVFGADAGLISERAKQIAHAFAAREAAPSEIIRIEDADLEGDPDRLIVELQTQPMFGGGKVVRTTLSRRVTSASLKQILEAGPPAAHLVVEGGNLKPSDAARKLFEAASWAAAIPCYADSNRDLAALATDMTRDAGMRLAPDAQVLLLERLGADRALSRGEIEKLILYAQGRTEITIDDVAAVVGDASDFMMDQIISAAASGKGAIAVRDFDRACAAGDSPQTLLLASQRYFLRLHALRAAVESGKSMDEAMRSLRPPVHFKQKDVMAVQCQAWPLGRLSAALARISLAIKNSRLKADIEEPIAERLLIDLATAARQSQRR